MKLASYLNPSPNPYPANISKGALAEIRIPEGFAYDCALPQQWLDAYAKSDFPEVQEKRYWQAFCQCVTVYGKEAGIFGQIVNLVTGEILS